MLIGLRKKQYQIEPRPFSSGGEGDIYRVVGQEDIVVKLYHPDRRTPEMQAKITYMSQNPPSESVMTQVAWPLDPVFDESGAFAGFVMPRLRITAELGKVYEYPAKTGITFRQKLILAENICVVIHAVHEAGYVFGDFNPRNIGVDLNTGMVAFLDTDSYHIVPDRAKNLAYRCNVCAPGYCAPELLKKCVEHIAAHPEDQDRAYAKTPLDTFTKETDNFALAIHMFRLLMNGFTPYGGIRETESASVGAPGVGDQAVKRDSYCFKKGNKPQSAAVPPMTIHPRAVQKLFARAFVDGRDHPEKRPSAYEWHKALEKYEDELTECEKQRTHSYRRGLRSCPWCEADEKYRASIAPRPALRQRAFSAPVTAQMPQSPPTPVRVPYTPPPAAANVQVKPLLKTGTFFNTFAFLLYGLGWIALLGGAGVLLRPFVNDGSFQFSEALLFHMDLDRAMLITGAGVLLVTLGSACFGKSVRLACLLSALWGALVCAAWSLVKTGKPMAAQSDPAIFLTRWSVCVLGLVCLIAFGYQTGKSWRKAHFRRLFAHPTLGAKESVLILLGLAVTGAYIWLLGDLPLFFRILMNHNLSLPMLFLSPAALYLLLAQGKSYGRKLSVRSIACTATLSFFTCFLLWIAAQRGDMKNTLLLVISAAGLILMGKLLRAVEGSLAGLTCVFMVLEYVPIVFPQFFALQEHLVSLAGRSFYLTALPPALLWVFTLLLLLYELIWK